MWCCHIWYSIYVISTHGMWCMLSLFVILYVLFLLLLYLRYVMFLLSSFLVCDFNLSTIAGLWSVKNPLMIVIYVVSRHCMVFLWNHHTLSVLCYSTKEQFSNITTTYHPCWIAYINNNCLSLAALFIIYISNNIL